MELFTTTPASATMPVPVMMIEKYWPVTIMPSTTPTVDSTTVITGEASTFDDLAEGQSVDSWVPEGEMCAESYPEQCTLEAIRVTG